MKTAVIMPSIRVPQNLEAWSAQLGEGDHFIIAGNEKSPHDEIQVAMLQAAVKHPDVSYSYLHPGEAHEYAIGNHLEPNHTHRRNLALLEALRLGVDYIITVDDDNFPHSANYRTEAERVLFNSNERRVVSAPSGWWNPGNLCSPHVIHRGYPLSQWNVSELVPHRPAHNERIGVLASLWLGDPDINAIERIHTDPQVTDVITDATLARGTWAPFDSQSTCVRAELAPLMFMWTGVGRYDDIWASYLMRAVMDAADWHVTYGWPLVSQERNPHNLLRDLRDELFGYEYTEELCGVLRGTASLLEFNVDPWEGFKACVEDITRYCTFLTDETTRAFKAWIEDIESIDIEASTDGLSDIFS